MNFYIHTYIKAKKAQYTFYNISLFTLQIFLSLVNFWLVHNVWFVLKRLYTFVYVCILRQIKKLYAKIILFNHTDSTYFFSCHNSTYMQLCKSKLNVFNIKKTILA